MKIIANTVEEYVAALPTERQIAIEQLRKSIKNSLPEGFLETINYGTIGYVVPHSLYPPGYHCDPKLPLPFMNIASQKNFIAVYHMGIYVDEKLMNWFRNAYSDHNKAKLDMGKSCIRFKKIEAIPTDLIGELASKITVSQWIEMYENAFRK